MRPNSCSARNKFAYWIRESAVDCWRIFECIFRLCNRSLHEAVSDIRLGGHIMWRIQTVSMGGGRNLICFSVSRVYFFVGGSHSRMHQRCKSLFEISGAILWEGGYF